MDEVQAYLQDYAAGKVPAPRGYWDFLNVGLPVPQPFGENWIEFCAAKWIDSRMACGIPAMPLPLLSAPGERAKFEQSRRLYRAIHGLAEWEKRHGQSMVSTRVVLGRQLVMGHYRRNGKFDPAAEHVELSIDQDHRIVRCGQEAYKRFTRMRLRLECCEQRNVAKVCQSPKVIYAGAGESRVQEENLIGALVLLPNGRTGKVNQRVEFADGAKYVGFVVGKKNWIFQEHREALRIIDPSEPVQSQTPTPVQLPLFSEAI